MLFLDLARSAALAMLAFMVGDAIGAALWESREGWALALGAFTLFSGILITVHRDEVRAYAPQVEA